MKAKYMHGFTLFCLLCALGILSGCSTVNTNRYLTYKREFLVQQGNPPAYVEGYVEGCSSGLRMAGDKNFKYRKDVERSERDALYARGWNDGQICCRNEMLVEKQNEAQKTGITDPRKVPADSRTAAEMRELWEELSK